MKKIKSVEHALKALGQTIDFDRLRDGMVEAGMPAGDVDPLIAHYKITKVIEAHNKLNGNWKADWGDGRQYKYCVWQWIKRDDSKPSGFGFSHSHYDFWFTRTTVGSRLVVGTYDAAIYIGTDFADLFETAWLIIEQEKSK
ncbi:hypothetical protein J3L18_00145 [Mucilaginibacter gossypii]|uniref:hypothetical protein n=1 Tax=Mucilaginibacter gossypii TaxID=551996 RepID=UPI000DCE371E|nr:MULTISPECIES: hypothetical protein [Mucilaginibacter]QTE37513.1 hypothetical protein J3L18_00145 [Mucilaginibacter gossypii]RAV52339.1 hypothetical protein DIU36_24705 [Mucilaginibacter rubeus]